MNEERTPLKDHCEIIIVDDTPDVLLLLSDILTLAGYSVLTADNGPLALDIIKLYSPSLVILDVVMPGMDGFEVCHELKNNESTREIPVIFISALHDKESTLKGFKAGGVDYISKPFYKEEILARVGAQMGMFRLREDLKEKNKALKKEISKRKQSKKALTKSENKYHYLFQNNPVPMWIYDIETHFFLEVNEAAIAHYGYSRMEFMKMKLKDIHSDEDIEEIIEQVELKSNKLTTDGIWKHKNSAGKISYAEIISHKIDYDSKPARLVIATDITTSVIDREELQKEKQLLRTLIDHLPVAIYVKDIGARKIVANKFDLAIIGVESESEILGKTDLEIFTTEIGLRGYNDDMTVINTGNAIINREEVFTDKDGNEQLILTSKIPLFNQKGVPTGLIGIGRNITESKKANEAIVQERQLLRTLIDHLPDAIYVKDKNARKLVANATDLKIMNCASETDVIGKTDLEIFHSDYERKGYDEDTSILKTGLPILNKEDCYSDSDGKLHWRIISKLPLIDHNGNITGLVGIGHDITEQKNALQTIQKLSTSIEQSPSIIIITNTNGDIEYVNPSLTEITGFTPEETIGKKPNIFKSGLTPNETYDELWKTISSGEVWRGELYNRKKSGEYYWEWVIITSLKNELGDITNYIAIKEDITLRKEMEADLIIAKEKAEENDRLKSAFLANMSHEIRTPLNCILGFADLLSEPVYHSDQQQCIEYAQLIMASGNNLLAIINDIMDISKIEAGQVHVRMAEFNPNELLLSIWKEFEIKALEKQIDLILTTPNSPTIKYIESDETKIKQVLINFVGNAIKFTEKGSVVIGHEFKGDFVRFFISDTGIGIPKKFHENIFERFRQIENTSTRKYGGTGLGLAISKSLIELLGGKIGMESIPNEGSTFYFTLPINHKRSKQIRV